MTQHGHIALPQLAGQPARPVERHGRGGAWLVAGRKKNGSGDRQVVNGGRDRSYVTTTIANEEHLIPSFRPNHTIQVLKAYRRHWGPELHHSFHPRERTARSTSVVARQLHGAARSWQTRSCPARELTRGAWRCLCFGRKVNPKSAKEMQEVIKIIK